MNAKEMKNSEAGIALIASMIIMMAIAIISAALLFTVTSQYRLSRRNKAEMVSVNLAEAGVEYAIWALNNDANFSGTGPIVVGEGVFSCSVRQIGATGRLITCTGTAAAFPAQRVIMVRAEMSPAFGGEEMFGFAAFGTSEVDLVTFKEGCLTNGYSSLTGYNTSVGNTGDIGSNSSITLEKNVTIGGDVSCGPAGTVTTSSPCTITGTAGPAETFSYLPDIPSETVTFCSTQPALNVATGVTVSLGVPGETRTYYFSSITTEKQGTIRIRPGARVIIYVSGDVNLKKESYVYQQGDTVNASVNFQIFCAGSSVMINKEGDFTGVVYAPNATVLLKKDGAYYGSFIAKKLTLNKNNMLHYDTEAAKIVPNWNLAGTQGVNVIVSWQRQ